MISVSEFSNNELLLVSLLKGFPEKVNQQDSSGKTLFIQMIERAYETYMHSDESGRSSEKVGYLIKELLQCNPRLSIMDNSGYDAIYYADGACVNVTIIEMMEEYRARPDVVITAVADPDDDLDEDLEFDGPDVQGAASSSLGGGYHRHDRYAQARAAAADPDVRTEVVITVAAERDDAPREASASPDGGGYDGPHSHRDALAVKALDPGFKR